MKKKQRQRHQEKKIRRRKYSREEESVDYEGKTKKRKRKEELEIKFDPIENIPSLMMMMTLIKILDKGATFVAHLVKRQFFSCLRHVKKGSTAVA